MGVRATSPVLIGRQAEMLGSSRHWRWQPTAVHRLRSSRVRPGQLLLVGTFRSDELRRRHPLRPMFAEVERGSCERIELRPLTLAATRELCQAIDGSVAESYVEAVHHRSAGNPFFIEELVAARRSGVAGLLDTPRDAGVGPDVLRTTLDGLFAYALLVADGDEVRFRHELGREVFYDELLPGDRARLHARLAERLAGSRGTEKRAS